MEFTKSKHFIGIIAPASKCANIEIKLSELIKLFELKGFKYKIANKIFENENLPFFAASKENRISGLKQFLYDPEVKIILAIRGGYGCTEIMLDCLSFEPLGQKTLIGISDITALHILFNQIYNLPTIHGTAYRGKNGNNNFQNIVKVLSGETIFLTLIPINDHTNLKREVNGLVTGGNLTVFCNMIGTPLAPQTKDKILILEDVNEKGYAVHRYLMHIKNAGLLNDISAVIFGDFLSSDEHIEEAITNFCISHIPHIPAYRTENVGHGDINYPFIFDCKAIIKDNSFIQESFFKLN